MRVDTALLCDYASVRENLLHVIAGGITRLWRAEYPAPMNVCLALIFGVHQMEFEAPHEVAVRIIGQDGQEIVNIQGGFQTGAIEVEVGEELLVPVAFDLRNAGLPGQGAYTVEISVDGTFQRSIQFWSQPRPTEG
jgi:Family of unknown function (DUF6941)